MKWWLRLYKVCVWFLFSSDLSAQQRFVYLASPIDSGVVDALVDKYGQALFIPESKAWKAKYPTK